jgi:hypothetical protein
VSKGERWCQNREVPLSRDKLRQYLFMDGAAPGIEVA